MAPDGQNTNPESLWQQIPIPLTRIARFDDCDAADALGDALGDRYLCHNNLIFAAVRSAALRLGYRFSSADNDLWRDYQTFPLMSLSRITSGRVIPYRDSANTLRRLIGEHPNMALSASFLAGNLVANHAFHESAHCVAHSVLASVNALSSRPQGERHAIELIMAEAFANTVETLGTLQQGNPLADLLFYSLNSYISPSEKQTDALLKSAEAGKPVRFRILFLAYFEANLNIGPANDAVADRITIAADLPREWLEISRSIADVAFGLNRGFRVNTTPAYFSYLGYEKEFATLTSSPWLGESANQRLARDVTDLLYNELCQPGVTST